MSRAFLIIFTTFSICASAWADTSAPSPEDLFHKALIVENGDRDMSAAIDLYKEAIRLSIGSEPWRGRALIHLGMCYERLGQMKEALVVYQSVTSSAKTLPADIVQEAKTNAQYLNAQLSSLLNSVDTKSVFAGVAQSAAVQKDGSILLWGSMAGSKAALRPTLLENAPSATAMAMSESTDILLGQDGTVLEVTAMSNPTPVAGLDHMIAVACGDQHNLALKNDGTIWVWGQNNRGQLGDSTLDSSSKAHPIPGFGGVVAIAAGGQHSVAVKGDGSVWTWGSNERGQLGFESTLIIMPHPKMVTGSGSIIAATAGESHTVVLVSDGTLWAWGDNAYGQLGTGALQSSNDPVKVSGLSGVQAIAAGPTYTLALKSDGTVWVWGDNTAGALGLGNTINRLIPVQIPGLTGVQSITAGAWHNMAIKRDGSVWAWGRNDSGQIGDGTTQNRLTPIQISSTAPAQPAN